MRMLWQGLGVGKNGKDQQVAVTDTFHAILSDNIPQDRCKEITYTSFVCGVCPQKEEHNCTRIIIWGYLIWYPRDTGTNTASLELFKLLLGSVLSRMGPKLISFDVKLLPQHLAWPIRVRQNQTHQCPPIIFWWIWPHQIRPQRMDILWNL